MIEKIYTVEADVSFRVFEFESVGKYGVIRKVVRYDETNVKGVYNLGFGDIDLKSGRINDLVVSDNGDMEVVLATVASTLSQFIKHHPDALVAARGSTAARTRLYRQGISKYLGEIEKDFEVFGFKDGEWQTFRKNVTFEAFMVRRKS